MNRQKTILREVATSAKAIKEARSAPVPEPEIDRSLAFLRAIVLDLPIQTGGMVEVPQTISEEQMTEMKKLAGLK